MIVPIELAPKTIADMDQAKKLFAECKGHIMQGFVVNRLAEKQRAETINYEKYIPKNGELLPTESKKLNLTADCIQYLDELCKTYRLTKGEAVHVILAAAFDAENFPLGEDVLKQDLKEYSRIDKLFAFWLSESEHVEYGVSAK